VNSADLDFAGTATHGCREPQAPLRAFERFDCVVVEGVEAQLEVREWMEAEHWLKSFRPVGHSLVQVIKEKGQAVAVVQWSSCAYRLKDREQWIGWNAMQCAQRRKLVVNNVRFLVRDRSPNLASKALAKAVDALPGQWRENYGYEPLVAETFTDPETHQGTCYKAAGWTPLGLTKGSRRHRAEFYVPGQSRKQLWVKPLCADARERLCARDLAPPQAAGEDPGRGCPLGLRLADLQSLAAAVRRVPDPRRKNRCVYLAPILSCLCFGMLCGATNLNAMVRHAHRLSQAQRREIGLRAGQGGKRRRAQPDTVTAKAKRFIPIPSYETFRRVLASIDLEALAAVLSQWLSAHRSALPAHYALDGKVIRQTLGHIVTLCDAENGVPVALAATPQMGGEQEASRRLLRRESTVLLNATVTADALFANSENAHLICSEKGGEYLISLKDNQPKLAAAAAEALEVAPFLT
jgi:hypothetical protein